MRLASGVLLLAASLALAEDPPTPGYVDLHIHLAGHLAVPVYGRGLDAPLPRGRTHAHGLVRQLGTDELAAPGPSVLVSLAYANPFTAELESRASMAAHIERQLAYVDGWAAQHADRFAVARTPREARDIVASGRKAVVHGIEGGTGILEEAGDARRWAARGVAVVTPVHLADNSFGGAWCQAGALSLLNLPGCRKERSAPVARGLTAAGRAAIVRLADAGVIVDLAHLSRAALSDALGILESRGVPPVYTHVTALAVRDDPTAMSDTEARRLTAAGGLMGVTANLGHMPPRPAVPGNCRGSLDDFRVHWDHFVDLVGGGPLGWGSDFQGGVDHLRPRFGPRGCAPAPPGATALDTLGLARADLVEPMFQALAAAGSDRRPLDASAERFLELWAVAQASATRP